MQAGGHIVDQLHHATMTDPFVMLLGTFLTSSVSHCDQLLSHEWAHCADWCMQQLIWI